jgi:hypothetical protein
VQHFDLENKDLLQTMETNVKALIELVAREFDAFQHYHIDVDSYKCVLCWWHAKEHKFPVVVMLVWQILKILMNQIKMDHIFSIGKVLINSRGVGCKLSILINSFLLVGCSKASNLVDTYMA